MQMKFKKEITFNLFYSALNGIYRNYFQTKRRNFGFIAKNSRVRFPILIKGIENVYLHENTHILGHSKIICTHAKFIMKKNSGSAEGLTVVTGNHPSNIGEFFIEKAAIDVQNAKDIIVEEDVWLAANVTLLAGITIGRGSIIGAGTVCRKSVPPYSVVIGNPARIVGFKFTPEQIIEHESKLYNFEERYDYDFLQKNYTKYYVNKLK
jgi:acetyltransferase-like isoleucine patch superfamily enzyme